MISEIITSYRQAWKNALYNWRLVFLLYIILLGLAFMALGPLSNVIKEVFGKSMMLQDFVSGFDYTSISDMLLHHGVAVNVSLSMVFSFFVIYLIWSSFYTGGLLEVAKHKNIRSSRLIFWKGSAEYFFRFLRLSFYLLLTYGVIFGISISIFVSLGVNPLHIESEQFIISRFKLTSIILLIIGFFLAIFRDITRALIVQRPNTFIISFANLKAMTQMFLPKFILLSLFNLLFLGLGLALYILLKSLIGSNVWALFIVGQLFLMYRILYRMVRISSYKYLVDKSIVFPLDHIQSDADIL